MSTAVSLLNIRHHTHSWGFFFPRAKKFEDILTEQLLKWTTGCPAWSPRCEAHPGLIGLIRLDLPRLASRSWLFSAPRARPKVGAFLYPTDLTQHHAVEVPPRCHSGKISSSFTAELYAATVHTRVPHFLCPRPRMDAEVATVVLLG